MHGDNVLKKYSVLIASVIFFVPVFVIALMTEWQFDEAWTYFGIMHSSYKDIAEYTQFKLANNHVINSLYFHLLQGFGAKEEISYRLLSLGSYVVYCVFIYKLLRQAGYKQGMSYLVLFLLPYVAYFSLGRGYAPAMACITAALYFYKSFEQGKHTKEFLFFVLSGCVASLSLFSFAFPFMAMLLVLVVTNFKDLLKPGRILILLVAVPVIAYVFVMGRIVNKNDLYIIGGNSLFVNGALSSIIGYLSLSGIVAPKLYMVVKILVCASLIPAVIVLIKRKVLYTEHIVMLVTIVLMALSHVFFGSKYPMFRGLMYLILLMYLPFVYTAFKKNYLVSLHLVIISAIGVYSMGLQVDKSLKCNDYNVLAYMAKVHKPLIVDNVNPCIELYDHLYFKDSVKVVQYEMEEPLIEKSFYQALDTVSYVMCSPAELMHKNETKFFIEKYELADEDFFIRK